MKDRLIPERALAFTERQALLGILALAALLRFINANSEYWYDEIASVQNYVRMPPGEVIQSYGGATNHVMNSLLTHAFVFLLGEEPWVVRLPSILFGIAGVWAFYYVARQLWESQIALLGTLMFAVSYHHVYYTQNARGYSAFLFFALLATGLLLQLLRVDNRRSTRKYGAAYAVAIALGTYSLLLMIFVVMGHAIVLLLAKRWRGLAWLFAGGVFALLLYAPMARDLAVYFTRQGSNTGVPLFSVAFAQELKPIVLLLAIGAIVLPLLLGRLARRQPLAAALLFVPLAFNIILPVWRGQGVHPRSFIYGLPLGYFFLMEGMDWARLRFRWIPWVGVAAATVVSLVMLVRYYPLPKQGFQQALAYIATHRGPGDSQIGLTLGGKAARFYDQSVVLIEDSDHLHQWLKEAKEPTWVLFTFEGYLQPELRAWLGTSTAHQATFPSVIGGGQVHVRLWLPDAEKQLEGPGPGA